MPGGLQHRVIVRARSAAGVRRILDAAGFPIGPYQFRNYWTNTGNPREIEAAEAAARTSWPDDCPLVAADPRFDEKPEWITFGQLKARAGKGIGRRW